MQLGERSSSTTTTTTTSTTAADLYEWILRNSFLCVFLFYISSFKIIIIIIIILQHSFLPTQKRNRNN
jgi:hypothetical protein